MPRKNHFFCLPEVLKIASAMTLAVSCKSRQSGTSNKARIVNMEDTNTYRVFRKKRPDSMDKINFCSLDVIVDDYEFRVTVYALKNCA